MPTAIELASTNELVDELHKRHDSSVFCGYRRVTKEYEDFCVKWRGDRLIINGMLFRTAYGITEEYFKEA